MGNIQRFGESTAHQALGMNKVAKDWGRDRGRQGTGTSQAEQSWISLIIIIQDFCLLRASAVDTMSS